MGITNSLEAFKEFRRILNEYPKEAINVRTTNVYGYPLDKIEQDLKVAKILKEKKVNIEYIHNWQKHNKLNTKLTIEDLLVDYKIFGGEKKLTLEEMKLIVEWLKGE